MIGVSLSSMMATLGSLYPELKYLGKAAENILQTRQEAPLPYREEAAQLSFFDVIFSHVDFAYEMGVPVLRDVSVFCKAGNDDGFGGALRQRKNHNHQFDFPILDVSKGSVTIGGCDIREQSPDALAEKWPSSFRTFICCMTP